MINELRTYRETDRVVVWFSCGSTSAVAAKMALERYGRDNFVLAYCDTGSEHPDNWRFLHDVERWLGVEATILKHHKYDNVWQLFLDRGFIKGPQGAPCTLLMKKQQRQQFEDFDDIQVFGYDADEPKRAADFVERNPEVKMWAPLIERGYTKAHCHEILQRAGIELPVMYHEQPSGAPYDHNNCIGCVKGGKGYWNKIRQDFPWHFAIASHVERQVGHSILSDQVPKTDDNGEVMRKDDGSPVMTKVPVWLDELDPDAGRFSEERISCDMLCSADVEQEMVSWRDS